MTGRKRAGRSTVCAVLAASMALGAGTGGFGQQPDFSAGPDFAGVAGSPQEHARITALCGPNRNANDGYAPAPAFPGQTKAPMAQENQGYSVELVAEIDRPWAMAFLPDGTMLVSLRNGGLRTVDAKGKVSEPLEGAPEIVQPRLGSGMYDVILDRNFTENRTVYLSWHTRAGGDEAAMGRVGSARLSPDARRLTDLKVLIEGADIQPRRIVQAGDGTLMILSAGVSDTGTMHQDLASRLGKVLRINPDGSIPADNPFLSTPGANPAIWAVGFRDVHSAMIHPTTGELWAAENTPRGGDELNIFRPGRNYGFPVISYGRTNAGALINGGKIAQDGMEQPLYYWNPSIAPSGMMIYSGRAFPAWKDNVFIGAMSGQQLVRLKMDGERVVGEEKLLMDRCQRIKSVYEGPDGLIYLLTDETPPRPNQILRLVPGRTVPPRRTSADAPVVTYKMPTTPEEEVLARGRSAYAAACRACHGPAGEGAAGPGLSDITDVEHIRQVIAEGVGSMPAIRYLSEAEREAVAQFVASMR